MQQYTTTCHSDLQFLLAIRAVAQYHCELSAIAWTHLPMTDSIPFRRQRLMLDVRLYLKPFLKFSMKVVRIHRIQKVRSAHLANGLSAHS